MIKHGKVYPFKGRAPSHLDPILEFVTKGWADAKEDIDLQLELCDVKGAVPFNGQRCVLARGLKRKLRPDAVAVGRSLVYVVIDGIAIRFRLSSDGRRSVKEFDGRGCCRLVSIRLLAPNRSNRLDVSRHTGKPPQGLRKSPKSRVRQLGVRAVGGGVVV
jgi:hypothetical protein